MSSNAAVSPRKSRPRLIRNHDTEERNRLVASNIGLLGKQVRRLYYLCPEARWFYPSDDAWQDGMIALLRAAELWSPEIAAFSTYATWSIRQVLCRQKDQARIVHVPENVLRKMYRGERLDVNINRKVVLHSQVASGQEADSAARCAADLFTPTDTQPEVPEQAHCQERNERLHGLLRHFLNARHRRALEIHYLEGGTLDDIATEFGVSRERARQIEVTALRLLRICLQKQGLKYQDLA